MFVQSATTVVFLMDLFFFSRRSTWTMWNNSNLIVVVTLLFCSLCVSSMGGKSFLKLCCAAGGGLLHLRVQWAPGGRGPGGAGRGRGGAAGHVWYMNPLKNAAVWWTINTLDHSPCVHITAAQTEARSDWRRSHRVEVTCGRSINQGAFWRLDGLIYPLLSILPGEGEGGGAVCVCPCVF